MLNQSSLFSSRRLIPMTDVSLPFRDNNARLTDRCSDNAISCRSTEPNSLEQTKLAADKSWLALRFYVLSHVPALLKKYSMHLIKEIFYKIFEDILLLILSFP